MAYFHYRCGERITLLNENCTAIRNDADFDHGIVVTAEPLQHDVLFEVKIDRLISSWSGSLEIGVTDINPLSLEFPACASKLQHGSWVMTSFSVTKNGATLIHQYGVDLDGLVQEDRVGVMRTSDGNLYFYVNGESQGLAATGLPAQVYGIVDLYGQCVQVSITSPLLREHNNDDCLSGSSVLAIDNDNLNVTLGGDLSELSLSSSNSFDIRMDGVNVNVSSVQTSVQLLVDKLRFHERCGSLIKLSNGHRTAERRRPLDEFNNGVVMTHRPLADGELFEIRIDRLVDKWSGSIEMGITTHNPSTLVFPATMTNMRSGTIMMSGCGILTNGKGTRREYGDFNLDELSEGDRVGMMRKASGDIHYFINGLDQGIAAQRVAHSVWGVIDLYGMTIRVSIVERDEREEQNLMTRRTLREQLQQLPGQGGQGAPLAVDSVAAAADYHDRLTFDANCGKHAEVINNGRTAHRPTAADDFNNAVVLTSRTLRPGELFQVRLDRVVTKWAGSIEIGVTTHNPSTLDFPFTMTNVRSGTWMMTGSGIMHNGTTVLEQYGVNLDRLAVGDRVGCVLHDSGALHFFVNGTDQGCAATHVPHRVYGVIDLYGQAVEATLLDGYSAYDDDTRRQHCLASAGGAVASTTTTMTSAGSSNAHQQPLLCSLTCAGELGLAMTVMTGGVIAATDSVADSTAAHTRTDFRFHYIHGSNARIINNGLTAWRPRPLAEFNDGIVFSNRPLRPGELFEITLDNIVDRWSGSVELGVTAVKPEEINLPSTATDLVKDTWMLSGSSVMENSVTILSKYPCDLDTLQAGTRIGVLVNVNRSLEFYKDGRSQGVACVAITPTAPIYAVVDLYGSCAQVSIVNQLSVASHIRSDQVEVGERCGGGGGGGADTPYPRSEDSMVVVGAADDAPAAVAATAAVTLKGILKTDDMLHRFSDLYGSKLISLQDGGRMAVRTLTLTPTLQQPAVAQAQQCILYSATCLRPDELFEVVIMRTEPLLAGGLIIGVTNTLPPPPPQPLPQESIATAAVKTQISPAGAATITAGITESTTVAAAPSTAPAAVSESVVDTAAGLGTAVIFNGITTATAAVENIPAVPAASMMVPSDACYITGNEVRYGNRVHSRFTPSLHWLREGDRVGVLRSSASSKCWKLMVNGEPVHHINAATQQQQKTLTNTNNTNSMYVFVGLHGSCASVAVVSRMLSPPPQLQPPPPTTAAVAVSAALPLNLRQLDQVVPAHVNMATVSGKMQDSLDHFPLADQDQQEQLEVSLEAPIASEELISIDNVESVQNSIRYEFHENHGRNVEVTRDHAVATRVASYNQGVLLVQPALNINQFVQVVVEKTDNRWQSSLIVGVVCCATVAERLNLPISALGFRGSCCIISNDWVCLNGTKTQSNYGERLDSLSVGSRVGVMLREDGLQLYIDGAAGETLPWIPTQQQQSYAVFDLYGQCTQVKLINDSDYDEPLSSCCEDSSCNPDFEKADLDCNEKEPKHNNNSEVSSESSNNNNNTLTLTAEPNNSIVHNNDSNNQQSSSSNNQNNSCLSLPLLQQQQTNTTRSMTPVLTTAAPPPLLLNNSSNRRNAADLHCLYLMEVVDFKRSLFLPEEFFTNEDPSCYCMNCYKFKSQDPEALKDESLIGWVTFPLKNLRNVQTEKWHSAYYGARLAAIRRILDRGQLLTKSQLSSCHLIGLNNSQNDESAQVISFSPSLQHCGTSEGETKPLPNPKRKRINPAATSSNTTQQIPNEDVCAQAQAQQMVLVMRECLAVRTAFQLLVKPGAYSVSANDYVQWSTKERGAVCLQALLLQLNRVKITPDGGVGEGGGANIAG